MDDRLKESGSAGYSLTQCNKQTRGEPGVNKTSTALSISTKEDTPTLARTGLPVFQFLQAGEND